MFKTLNDIFTGKTASFSRFLTPIIEDIVKGLENLQAGSLIHYYAEANLAASLSLLHSILVDTDWRSEFQEQSGKLGHRESGQLFKVFTARFLVTFLHNEENVATVRLSFGPPDKFIEEVLRVHSFDSHEAEYIFLDLWKYYEEEASTFAFRFYRHCLRAIGLSFDKEVDYIKVTTLLELSSGCYTDVLIARLGGGELSK